MPLLHTLSLSLSFMSAFPHNIFILVSLPHIHLPISIYVFIHIYTFPTFSLPLIHFLSFSLLAHSLSPFLHSLSLPSKPYLSPLTLFLLLTTTHTQALVSPSNQTQLLIPPIPSFPSPTCYL